MLTLTEISKIFIGSFSKHVFKKSGEFIKQYYKTNVGEEYRETEKVLQTHFTEIINWSSRIQFVGMSTPKMTEESSIELTVIDKYRKYDTSDENRIKLYEADLLVENENYIIFGDPGAGKTTTMKRLATKFIFDKSVKKQSFCSFPILVRLREVDIPNIYVCIAQIVGLNYTLKEERHEGGVIRTIYHIGDTLIENAIPIYLNEIEALLLIDGFDELKTDFKKVISKQITVLGRKLNNSKVILTCRFGEDVSQFRGFSFCQIEKLTQDQIESIVTLWCVESEVFFGELADRPYKEIINRPLFLSLLVMHHNKLKYLPLNSADAYKQIIYLLLNDWEKDKGIHRRSKYSKFLPVQKVEFLSDLSFLLTYQIQNTIFSHSDFLYCYRQLHKKYYLPEGEGTTVASEIESHTGIIHETYHEKYEFSHLTIQEYLCGDVLARQPLSDKIYEYLKFYPAPIAIATTISSDSGRWLAALILNPSRENMIGKNVSGVVSLVTRLLFEKPSFNVSIELGITTMYLYYALRMGNKEVRSLMDSFYSLINVEESVENALIWYSRNGVCSDRRSFVRLDRNFHFNSSTHIQTPLKVALPKNKYSKLNHGIPNT